MIADIGVTIALVDDSLPLRRILSIYLAAQGFKILFEADHGRDLLTALEAMRELPDLCLLDTSMPVMNGYETARELAARYPSIQIMAYSFFDSAKSSQFMLDCGAHDFISKDASAEELRDALQALFIRSRAHSGDADPLPASTNAGCHIA